MNIHRAPCFLQAPLAGPREQRTIHLGFLDIDELSVFALLIRHRRPLPVYLGGFWRCYACLFESTEFAAMAQHIMRAHEPAPSTKKICSSTRSKPGHAEGRSRRGAYI